MEAASDHTKKGYALDGASSESQFKRKSVGRSNVGRPKMENNFCEVILDGGVKCGRYSTDARTHQRRYHPKRMGRPPSVSIN